MKTNGRHTKAAHSENAADIYTEVMKHSGILDSINLRLCLNKFVVVYSTDFTRLIM